MNIDIAIFVSFLALNLIVGLSYGRGVKTIKDYALGGRNFSTGALVATIVAAWISGSGFFITLSKTYSDGLPYLIASCSMALSLIVTAYFLVPKMSEFLGTTSVAEAMGDLYGRDVRIITAICGIVGNIGGIAVQFKVFGNVFNYFLGIEGSIAIILASTIAITYSAFGGIRSVTYTDILQFFTFGFAIPLIGVLIWNHARSLGIDYSLALDNPIFDYRLIFSIDNPKLISTIFLILYFACPTIDSMDFQRISMGRNISQVKNAFLISAALLLIIELTIAWIPFLIFSIDSTLKPNQLVSYIVNNYTHTGLKGLAIVGISAMAMSTADSRMNAASVLFANDIGKILKIKIEDLLLSRIFAVFLGTFSLYLALKGEDLLGIVMASASFYMPIVTVPLIFSILGFRSSTKSVLIAMGAGFSTVVIWKLFNLTEDCIIPAMIINFIFLFGSHYILKQSGGWIKANKDSVSFMHNGIADNLYSNTMGKKVIKFNKKLARFNLIEFFKKHSPKNELTYMSFGIYCIVYTFATMYSTQAKLFSSDSKTLLYIYQIMLCTSICMAMYPIWPPRVKHEIIVQVSWNFVLFYMLVFFSGFFVLISNFYPLQFVVFTVNIIVIALLSSWRTALIMTVPGFYASILFYKYYSGITDGLDVSLGSPQYVMMYGLVLLGVAFIIFLRPREYERILAQQKAEHLASTMNYKDEELQKALALKNEFIRNVTHEYHAPMTGVINTAEALLSGYQFLDDYSRIKAIETIYNSAIRLESFDGNIRDLARLSSGEAELSIIQVNFSDLVIDRLNICKKLYIENIKQTDYSFVINIEDDILVEADEYYLTQTLDNLITNALSYCKQGTIKLELIRKGSIASFSITDQGIGIPKDELQDIFGSFTVSSKTRTPAGGRGVGLALCKKVLEMHKGDIKAESSEGYTTFIFSLPLVYDDLALIPSEEMIGVAKKLIQSDSDIKLIAKVTGMSEIQIKALKKL